MNRRVTLVEQYFYPDGWSGAEIPRSIAEFLAARGWQVDVLCGADQYVPTPENQADDPRRYGIRLTRIPQIVARKDIRQRKWLRQFWFYVAALPILLFRNRPDLYLVQTNPPLIPIIVALVAGVQRRPFILVAMDLYPEVMFAHGMIDKRSLVGRILSAAMKWAYARAARVVALGPTMRTRLLDKGVRADRIEIISNWATGRASLVRGRGNKLAKEWDLESAPVILYSGNLGIAHDVIAPIAAFKAAVTECPELKLVFIGAGSRLEEAKRLVAENGVEGSVQFHDLVPADRMPESMGIARAALVTLSPGFEGLVVPSKLLGYMARGVPTLYIGPDSDASQLIQESEGGVVFRNEDIHGAARFMCAVSHDLDRLDALGNNARRYYDAHLSREAGLARYGQVLDAVVDNAAIAFDS